MIGLALALSRRCIHAAEYPYTWLWLLPRHQCGEITQSQLTFRDADLPPLRRRLRLSALARRRNGGYLGDVTIINAITYRRFRGCTDKPPVIRRIVHPDNRRIDPGDYVKTL